MTNRNNKWSRRMVLAGMSTAALVIGAPFNVAQAQDAIKVGLVAALSGQSAKSGEAITRGLQIAIDEFLEAGDIRRAVGQRRDRNGQGGGNDQHA